MLGPFFSFQEGCLSVVLVGMVVPCDFTPNQGFYCFLMSLYLEQASCSSGTHARASGIIFFTHTQSKLMGLYMKRGARCGGAQVGPGSTTAAAARSGATHTQTHTHTHTNKHTHIYI